MRRVPYEIVERLERVLQVGWSTSWRIAHYFGTTRESMASLSDDEIRAMQRAYKNRPKNTDSQRQRTEVTFEGKTQILKAWAAELGVPWYMFASRVRLDGDPLVTIKRCKTNSYRKCRVYIHRMTEDRKARLEYRKLLRNTMDRLGYGLSVLTKIADRANLPVKVFVLLPKDKQAAMVVEYMNERQEAARQRAEQKYLVMIEVDGQTKELKKWAEDNLDLLPEQLLARINYYKGRYTPSEVVDLSIKGLLTKGRVVRSDDRRKTRHSKNTEIERGECTETG